MKRITSIQIENYRSFFGNYNPVSLPNGQNLLIYGENGSGKSSLFKAVSNFFSSSRQTDFLYIKNHHQITGPGQLQFTFNDYDIATGLITSSIGEIVTFGSDIVSTDSSDFIKNAELVRGFLDYRRLLDVYNHKEAKPNLFDLIVTDLLLNYIPPGGVYALGIKWNEVYSNLRYVYNRNERKHKRALEELPTYEGVLKSALNRIFLQLNVLLIKYFKLNLRVWYSLLPTLPYNYTSWNPISDLRLVLKLNGINIENQADILNEARLAALSICLYLSALMRNPQILDYKILFLDDVFIGLDTGNRLPILNILHDEFKEYQIFISTYDRHWFELAKRHFEIEVPGKWLFSEFYVGNETLAGIKFEKPIIVVSDSNYERAIQYLHDRSKPDYPASANYFRKALEQLVQEYIPAWELAGEDYVQIPDYKLNGLLARATRFLEKTGNSTTIISKIFALLPSLLHPLSHHNINSPIYKGELLIIQTLIPKLKDEFIALDIFNNYKCSILEGRNKIEIKYVINAGTGHFSFYELRTTEPVTLKKVAGANPIISKVHCVVEKCWGENHGAMIPGTRKEFTNIEKANPNLNFDSLEQAFDQLHARMIQIPAIGNFPKAGNYINTMRFLDTAGNLQPLASAVVW